MHKKGEKRHNWTRRWFELNDGRLVYSESMGGAVKGEVGMATATDVRPSTREGAEELEIQLVCGSGREYNLRCDNSSSCHRWLQALNEGMAAARQSPVEEVTKGYLLKKGEKRTNWGRGAGSSSKALCSYTTWSRTAANARAHAWVTVSTTEIIARGLNRGRDSVS